MTSLAGKWEGLTHDIEGFSGRLDLDLNDKGSGEFTFTQTGDHCSEEPRRGKVEGDVSKDGTVTLRIASDAVAPMAFEGKLHPVKVHAEAAIIGTFSDPSGNEGRGGVAIFWRYAKQR